MRVSMPVIAILVGLTTVMLGCAGEESTKVEKTQAPLIETTPIPTPKIELTKKEPSELALTFLIYRTNTLLQREQSVQNLMLAKKALSQGGKKDIM